MHLSVDVDDLMCYCGKGIDWRNDCNIAMCHIVKGSDWISQEMFQCKNVSGNSSQMIDVWAKNCYWSLLILKRQHICKYF